MARVEQYINAEGEAAMRLTAKGEQGANQAAKGSEDDAAALLGDARWAREEARPSRDGPRTYPGRTSVGALESSDPSASAHLLDGREGVGLVVAKHRIIRSGIDRPGHFDPATRSE